MRKKKEGCTDCGGGTPAPLWKRCEECALTRIRVKWGAIAPSVTQRRFAIGSRVFVLVPSETAAVPGKVARCPQGTDYVVDLERGGRVYVQVTALREASIKDLTQPSVAL